MPIATAGPGPTLGEIAAHWREARRLYRVYAPLARQYELAPPSADLESPVDRKQPEALQRIALWFDQMDEKTEVWHIRQLFQTTHLGTEDNLAALIARHLHRVHMVGDAAKLDFLLVQYFTQRAPLSLHDRDDIDLETVAEVLEPVLGEAVPHAPEWAQPLDAAIAALPACHSLADLFAEGVLDAGRKVKDAAGEMFFGTAALLSFTRFNFLVRRTFFRLLQSDLHAIRTGLRDLESLTISTVDCTRAGLGDAETLASLRHSANDWKTAFRAPYDAGRPLLTLALLREAVTEALAAALAAPPAPVPEPIDLAPEPSPEAAPETAAPIATEEPAPEEPAVAEPPAEAAPDAPTGPPTAPANVEETVSSTGPAASDGPPTVEEVLEVIAAQLLDGRHTNSVTRLDLRGSKLLLASWEVAAFVRGGDETADALQRAVAARCGLVFALDRAKRGDSAWLAPALSGARREMAQVQNQVVRAKDAKDIDAAVNLAASATRLLSLIQEAGRLAGT